VLDVKTPEVDARSAPAKTMGDEGALRTRLV